MEKTHTYFYVRVSIPVGYDNIIDEELRFYCKINNLNFSSNKHNFELKDSITESLLRLYSTLTFEEFKLKNYTERKDEFEKIIKNLGQFIYRTILEKFNPKTTEYKNVFLIEMKYFKDFILKFSKSPYINWDSISSSKYYDWDVECLTIGKDVLNWTKLMENKTTLTLIKSKDFPQDLKSELQKIEETLNFNEDDENWKSLFVIKEYSGVLSEYFRLENIIENEVKNKIPNIKGIKWLASYSTPFDIMNREKLKFDLSDFDYILAFDIDTEKDGTNSNIAKKMALEQNLEINYTLNDLIKNACC